jgi:hypothetical protein
VAYRVHFAGPLSADFDQATNVDRDYVAAEYYDNKQLVANATPLFVADPTTTLNVQLAATGTVRGKVLAETDLGQLPLHDARVFLIREDGVRAGPFLTDGSGNYLAGFILPGDWRIHFQPPITAFAGEYWSDRPTLAEADSLTVVPRVTTAANAVLDRAGLP